MWVTKLDRRLAQKLAACGLIEERRVHTLRELLDYVWSQLRVKQSTLLSYSHVRRNLIEFFGPDRQLATITPGDAEEFGSWLKRTVPAAATSNGRSRRARQFFAVAVKKRWLAANPFDGLRCGSQENRERMAFVSGEVIDRVLDQLTDDEYRLILVLARYGGLRVPSEPLVLTWDDVDWDRGTIRVRAPKTGVTRLVPIFPEIRPWLERCFHAAEPGSRWVVARHRMTGQALSSILVRAIGRAGVPVWPKLWQNLRSTRETELAESYPIHVVCQWIGNSPRIAARHYLQVTDEHLRRAKGEASGEAKGEARSFAQPNINGQQATQPNGAGRAVLPSFEPRLTHGAAPGSQNMGDTGPAAPEFFG